MVQSTYRQLFLWSSQPEPKVTFFFTPAAWLTGPVNPGGLAYWSSQPPVTTHSLYSQRGTVVEGSGPEVTFFFTHRKKAFKDTNGRLLMVKFSSEAGHPWAVLGV